MCVNCWAPPLVFPCSVLRKCLFKQCLWLHFFTLAWYSVYETAVMLCWISICAHHVVRIGSCHQTLENHSWTSRDIDYNFKQTQSECTQSKSDFFFLFPFLRLLPSASDFNNLNNFLAKLIKSSAVCSLPRKHCSTPQESPAELSQPHPTWTPSSTSTSALCPLRSTKEPGLGVPKPPQQKQAKLAQWSQKPWWNNLSDKTELYLTCLSLL